MVQELDFLAEKPSHLLIIALDHCEDELRWTAYGVDRTKILPRLHMFTIRARSSNCWLDVIIIATLKIYCIGSRLDMQALYHSVVGSFHTPCYIRYIKILSTVNWMAKVHMLISDCALTCRSTYSSKVKYASCGIGPQQENILQEESRKYFALLICHSLSFILLRTLASWYHRAHLFVACNTFPLHGLNIRYISLYFRAEFISTTKALAVLRLVSNAAVLYECTGCYSFAKHFSASSLRCEFFPWNMFMFLQILQINCLCYFRYLMNCFLF